MFAAVILSTVLVVLAALHLLWAFRIWVPIPDEARLARTVTGFPGVEKMPPPLACALVALVLMIAAALPFWPQGTLRSLGLIGMITVFGLRGLAAFTPQWRKLTPVEPFATLDRRYFGPLCLGLAVLSALAW
jgi:hypothetical protein